MLKFLLINKLKKTKSTSWFLSLLISVVCCQFTYSQQITVDNSQTPQQLIEDNLVLGCVEVSNIVSNINGSANNLTSFGYFERANSNFPFENGILLSTGRAEAAGNTVNTNVLNDGNTTWGTDMDLEAALGITETLNATTIEFDFVSVANQISFNYILASEEYINEQPCTYSDGFAFLIREAGTSNPYTNIALIPGTNTPVNTTTIHDEIVGFCPAENEEFFEGYNVGDTNFNGRTTVLTASTAIQPNVEYHIKLVIADQGDQFYDSAVFIEGNSFNSNVDLGPDITTCATNTTISADIQNPLATYEWFKNDVLLTAESNTSLFVTDSGVYRVLITIPINNTTCTIEDEISITLESEQPSNPISDFELCDDPSNDGIETFNLPNKDSEILNAIASGNYNITYHLTQEGANNGVGSINNPIQNTNNPQTIYVRVEDIDNGCLAFLDFNLIVNPLPVITDPTPLEICDDSISDGLTSIDLNNKNDEITNGDSSLIVTYHFSALDAQTGNNPIPQPYTNTNQTEQLFVRVINPSTGCASFTTIDVSVLNTPDIESENLTINACEGDDDGFAIFDLTEIIDNVLNGLTGVTTTFHLTQEDAETGNNPIADITNFQNTTPNIQTIFIRVVDDSTGCFSIATITLHTNLLITGTTIRDFFICDDSSNDGIEDFNLENIATLIINGLVDVSVVFYETEEDQTNQQNPIDQTVPYTVNNSPQEIFVTIIGADCIHETMVNLVINDAVEIQALDPVFYCDTDDDGFTSIELATFDAVVSSGIANPVVSYFETQTDAQNNENVLPPFYANSSNPQSVFVRVSNSLTNCFDVSELIINVVEAPTVTQATNEVICDDDQDGFFIVNLNNKIPEIVSNPAGLVITFHTTLDDANLDMNAEADPNNFNANTQTIYTRVENPNTTCYAISSFEIIVNTEPVFPNITNFEGCENDGNQVADFIFNEKDEEILNGQTGKQVLYFETQNDALNRTNIIDKNNIYQNTSAPQTIFVRVENLTDDSCFGVSSFELEVGSIPIFNAPLNWFVCDDISNDGVEEFNLQEKIDEISLNSPENLTITFYSSLSNAENSIGELPLNYINTSNPQQIYARIENGTFCHSIAEFGLNIVQVPMVNTASSQEACDTDLDGFVEFDLTVSEFEILDVRDDNIEISYHPSLEDAEADTNTISSPENYTNVSNPQTVYVKVNNVISNCFVTVPVELIVNIPPTINNTSFEVCDNDTNTINLDEARPSLIGTQQAIATTYFANATDAQNNQNALDANYTYTSDITTIFVRATNVTTSCFSTSSFVLQVNPIPTTNSLLVIEFCDDDFDQELAVNLTQFNSTIIGSQDASQLTVTYYLDENDAINNDNEITTPENFISISQTIYARITNNQTSCFSTTSFDIQINRKPFVEIPDQVVCLDNLPLIVSAETGEPTDSYSWSTNESSAEIEIVEVGNYSVTVTTAEGCTTTVSFTVTESEQATIEFTETVDFSDPNNITVTVSGIGNYLYQLNDNEPQASNVFVNVPLGPNTIYIIDLNGCASATKEVVIIDAPKFVTPNQDGYFDTWHITGVEQLVGTTINIFDRYGKQMAFLKHNTRGWDGTYNGKNMPATDYWFVADVVTNTRRFQVKGHFALVR